MNQLFGLQHRRDKHLVMGVFNIEECPRTCRRHSQFRLDTCFSCTRLMASVSVHLSRVPDSQLSFSRP